MRDLDVHGSGLPPADRGARRNLLSRRKLSVLIAAAALAFGLAVPAASFADSASGCDFAANGTTPSCSPPLAGSSFAGADGNLLASPTTFGTTDWQNVAGLNPGFDLPSGTGDNSFGQGTKEDNPNVTVVTGSIPPNKSDLTRFYEASEIGSNGHNFLYLAWERSNVLGSANMDFEINQNATSGFTGSTTGPVTLSRTAGDLLVTYDFTNGGGRPTLGLLTWLTAAAGNTASQCFSSSMLPCWGKEQTLNGADSIGAVNNLDAVTDPLFPSSPNYINPVPALQFGETAIDLTAAGVFPAGTCKAFGSAFVKSRASASFGAEVKDFIAPINVNISNCGTIRIHKVTVNGDSSFGYTTTGGLTPATFNLSNGGTQTYGPETVQPGSYTVTESNVPAGWTLTNLVCTSSGTGTSASTSLSTAAVSITMAAQGLVDCTYTNKTKLKPAITTVLKPSSTIPIDTAGHDTATLAGASANAGGTVDYRFYGSLAACQADASAFPGTAPSGGTDVSTVTVTSGSVPDSSAVTFHNAGTFYWAAFYSGDSNNTAAVSDCTTELLVVPKAAPAITTVLKPSSTIPIDTAAHDTATLAGASANAGGTVDYRFYGSLAACQADASAFPGTAPSGGTDVSTVTVTSGSVPDSSAVTFHNAGTFYWAAFYSGDSNNTAAVSDCTTELLVVPKAAPAMSTAPNLIPNDDATISGASSNAGGTITFSLFSPADATCSGTPAFTQQVTVNGNGTYNTTNSTFIASSIGEWRWQVIYTGDANNVGTTSACGVENFTITSG
jgi:hypothetical protein